MGGVSPHMGGKAPHMQDAACKESFPVKAQRMPHGGGTPREKDVASFVQRTPSDSEKRTDIPHEYGVASWHKTVPRGTAKRVGGRTKTWGVWGVSPANAVRLSCRGSQVIPKKGQTSLTSAALLLGIKPCREALQKGRVGGQNDRGVWGDFPPTCRHLPRTRHADKCKEGDGFEA